MFSAASRYLHSRSDQNWEYLAFSAASSIMMSSRSPVLLHAWLDPRHVTSRSRTDRIDLIFLHWLLTCIEGDVSKFNKGLLRSAALSESRDWWVRYGYKLQKAACQQAPQVTTPFWPAKMSFPRFFQQPLLYLRWASHEKPAIFYSFIIGSAGPAMFFVGPPIRRWFGDDYERERIPLTYPGQ